MNQKRAKQLRKLVGHDPRQEPKYRVQYDTQGNMRSVRLAGDSTRKMYQLAKRAYYKYTIV